jgi:magnesium chelatase subunit D
MGVNTVEREGISISHPARFILVGTMNPEEGDLRPQLLDRFGLCVDVAGIDGAAERTEVVKRAMKFDEDPEGFRCEWENEEAALGQSIVAAAAALDNVCCSDEMLDLAAKVALEMDCKTHRADITMVKTACTIAAFDQRDSVSAEDIRQAAALVLPHRMRRKPLEEPQARQQDLDDAFDKHDPDTQNQPPPEDQPEGGEQNQDDDQQQKPEQQQHAPYRRLFTSPRNVTASRLSPHLRIRSRGQAPGTAAKRERTREKAARSKARFLPTPAPPMI